MLSYVLHYAIELLSHCLNLSVDIDSLLLTRRHARAATRPQTQANIRLRHRS